jgi:hypothetical protein
MKLSSQINKETVMKKSYLAAVLILMCLLGTGIGAHAQDMDAVVVNVPFEFLAGSATLPAGDYKVSRLNPAVNRELAISGYNKGTAFLLPLAFDDVAAANGQPTLSFEHIGGKYFLTGIKTLSGVYTMPASREMVMLGKSAPNLGGSTASGSH